MPSHIGPPSHSQARACPARQESGNSPGGDGLATTVVQQMRAFDALPPAMRAALAAAGEDWCAVDILARWQRAARAYGVARATRAGVRAVLSGGWDGQGGQRTP